MDQHHLNRNVVIKFKPRFYMACSPQLGMAMYSSIVAIAIGCFICVKHLASDSVPIVSRSMLCERSFMCV